VSLAPAESYFDFTTSNFDRSLLHSHNEWETNVDFKYHSWNVYGYVFSRYEFTLLKDGSKVPTFDWIFVQFYEGYSHILYNTTFLNQTPADYLANAVISLSKGWTINFSHDPEVEYPDRFVKIPIDSIVIGLANGWADDKKFLFLSGAELKDTGDLMHFKGISPRGFGFWNIFDEGTLKDGNEYWLTKIIVELNAKLKKDAFYKQIMVSQADLLSNIILT
jgi:hypothetical protein